jgi:hypothetical protein
MSTKRSKFAGDEVAAALTTFAAVVEGRPPTVVHRAQTFRGADPIVRARPERFIAAEVPESERPTQDQITAGAVERVLADRPRPAPAPAPTIAPQAELGDLLVCTLGIVDSPAGPCRVGEIVANDDPRAVAVPDAFAPLIDHLGGR